jgi:hypothetical protein
MYVHAAYHYLLVFLAPEIIVPCFLNIVFRLLLQLIHGAKTNKRMWLYVANIYSIWSEKSIGNLVYILY